MANPRYDYLLIGGGRASANAAQAIREHDGAGTIAIVAGEDRKPYDRPPLSKNFLEGQPPQPEDVESKPDDFYDDHRVELMRGAWADSIDPDALIVALRDGRRFEYGKLLLATGASPIELKLPGADRDNLFYLRTVDDSVRIRDAARDHKRAVLVGAGYIGSEVSASLTGLGVQCTVIGLEDRLWNKVLSEKTSRWLQRYFESKGVQFRLKSRTTGFTDQGVELEGGEVVEGDLIVVGIGVRQNVGLARDAGLEVADQGVVVDSSLRTSNPQIWAAGDIAYYDDVNFGRRWRLEHYMNADWQGTLAGTNMATGEARPMTEVPYFFSDLFDLHFLLRGDPFGGQSTKVIGDMESGEFTELYAYEDGRLARGVVFTRDGDLQDKIGDKIAEYALAKRPAAEIDAAALGI